MHSRIITAITTVGAAGLAAGIAQALTFSDASTTFEVKMDFALLVTGAKSTLLNGTMVLELSEVDASNNVIKTYQIPFSQDGLFTPPIAFKSGARVIANVRNSGAVGSGASTCYGIFAVLVPSVDFDREKYPESLPPYFPRPFA